MTADRITVTYNGLIAWLGGLGLDDDYDLAALADELAALAEHESTGTPPAEAGPLVDPARVHRTLAEDAVRGEAATFAMVSPAVADRVIEAAAPHLDAIIAELDNLRAAAANFLECGFPGAGRYEAAARRLAEAARLPR